MLLGGQLQKVWSLRHAGEDTKTRAIFKSHNINQ